VLASGRVCVVVRRVAPAVAAVGCRCVGGGVAAFAVPDGEKCLKREMYYSSTRSTSSAVFTLFRERFSTAGGVAEGVEKSEKSLSSNTPLPRQLAHKPFVPRPIAAAITLTGVFPSFSPNGTYLSSTVFASVFFHYILSPFIFCYLC